MLHIVILALVYVITARLGQVVAVPPGNITPVWIPSGIILAATLLYGNKVWPGIFIGAFIGNIWAYLDIETGSNIAAALFSATCNGAGDAACALVGAHFIRRTSRSTYPFNKGSHAIVFIMYAALLGSAISATAGITSLSTTGLIQWNDYIDRWLTWWIGDAVGIVLITPVLLSLYQWKQWQWLTTRNRIELFIFAVSFVILNLTIVNDGFLTTSLTLPITLILPLLIWSIYRFPAHITFTSILVTSTLLIVTNAQFFYPISKDILHISILEIQLFLSSISITALILLANKNDKESAEKSLVELNHYNRTLFETLPIGLALCDLDGKLIDINAAYANMLGRSVEETKGLSYWDITPKKYAEQETYQLQCLEKNGLYGPYNKEYIHKNGEHIPVQLHGRKIELDNTPYIWSCAEDISEQEKAKEELLTTERRYQALFSSAAEAVIITNARGIISSYNHSAQMLFGYGDEILGENVKILVPQSNRHTHDDNIANYHKTGGSTIVGTGREVYGVRKNGETFPIHITIEKYEYDKKIYFMAIIRDLSDEKKQKRVLEKATVDAINANHAKSEFLSSMSHELRTPLNAILGFSQLLELNKEDLTEDQLVSVNEIQQGGKHLLALIDEILDLSKVESGKFDIKMKETTLSSILDECLHLTYQQALDNNTPINITEHENTNLYCDPLRLKQIILNYLTNAIKYNRNSGSISITCKPLNRQYLRITVSDDGPGLSKEKVALLFRPFERVGEEKGAIQGTGIGLALCKKLAQLMKAQVGVNSTPGGGSDFWVDVLISDEREENKHIPLRPEAPTVTPTTQSVKILYFEDNLANALFMEHAFKPHQSRYSLTTVSDPSKGLELASSISPELILLDITMPGMNGYEVLKHLRAEEKTRDIPVIAVSANAMKLDIQKGLAAGFSAYLSKPINLKALFEAINKALH